MHKNQKRETSFAIYLINGAVASLIAVVAYFNGPDLPVIVGYFVLIALTSLFYNYKVCLTTAACSMLSYGLIIGYFIQKQIIPFSPSELLIQLTYFLSVTAIVSWLVFKLQRATPGSTPSFEAQDKTRTLLNSLPDGAILLNHKKQIILVNHQAEKILGIKEDKILSTKNIGSFTHPSYQNLYKILTLGKESGSFSQEEITLEKPRKMVLQVMTAPIAQDKKQLGLLKMIRDITHEKEVDTMKSELISIVSHQLRTPLSAVKWGIKMLLDGDAGEVSKEQKDILAKGYRSNERMIHLVNDLLNISRIEEGRFQYKFAASSIENLVDTTIKEFSYFLEEKQISLKCQKSEKPAPPVWMDLTKIHVVLQNLLSNAINYTPTGGEIIINLKAQDPFIEVSIKDNGMGIPEDQKASLFQRFFRADNAIRTQTEGSGLGLFIARNIIENHKGRVWAESEENKGSTFYFTLPIAK